jgi:quinol-cytochrome oxidoreductase complex cytochrome b subunit
MSTAWIVALCCLGVMLLFFLIWRKQYKELKKMRSPFFIVYIIGWLSFLVLAAVSVVNGEDPNFDWTYKSQMITVAITCIWYGAWCAQYKMDKSEGIARKN